jgi:hypothetical protein
LLTALTKLFSLRRKKQVETQEELIIRWGDTLITQSNYKGDIDTSSFLPFDGLFHPSVPTPEERIEWSMDKGRQIRNEIVAKFPLVDGNLDPLSEHISKFRETVLKHLLNEGYISEPIVTSTTWQITDKGKLVKELNGHEKYKKYRQRELHILRNQNTINWLLFSAAAASAIIPFIVAIFFSPTNVINVTPKYQRLSHNDSVLIHRIVEDALTEIKSTQDTATLKLNKQTKQVVP